MPVISDSHTVPGRMTALRSSACAWPPTTQPASAAVCSDEATRPGGHEHEHDAGDAEEAREVQAHAAAVDPEAEGDGDGEPEHDAEARRRRVGRRR